MLPSVKIVSQRTQKQFHCVAISNRVQILTVAVERNMQFKADKWTSLTESSIVHNKEQLNK